MEQLIKTQIDNPEALEDAYQKNKEAFRQAFFSIYPDISGHQITGFWKVRLDFEKHTSKLIISMRDVTNLFITIALLGVLVKLPQILQLQSEDAFFMRNIGLILFTGVSLYAWLSDRSLRFKEMITTALIAVLATVYVNLLPQPVEDGGDEIMLVFLHLPLMLWCIYGLIHIRFNFRDLPKRFDYLKYNGDLVILGIMLALGGGFLTVITIGIFEAVNLDISGFYEDTVIPWGVVAAPVIATIILQKLPSLTQRISSIMAAIFSPLVLITLIAFLISMIATGKSPYADREFLIIFNVLLIGVMAVIIFTVTEDYSGQMRKISQGIILALVLVTLIVDVIALSAIIYRLGEFGLSPNRAAVLGSNLLVFGNLVLILFDLLKINFRQGELGLVRNTITRYLPIYFGWTVIVVVLFPLIF